MKKKIIIGSVIAISLIIASVLTLTNMFTKGVITGKLYRVENVYEEIWNMVISEKHGTRTVLTTSIEGSYVDYDLGSFQHVSIPVNDEYHVTMSFRGNKFGQEELCISLFKNNSKYIDGVSYVYNYQTNTLYGEQEEAHLIDVFMSRYYAWAENDGEFHSENPGDYTFVLERFPLSHNETALLSNPGMSNNATEKAEVDASVFFKSWRRFREMLEKTTCLWYNGSGKSLWNNRF